MQLDNYAIETALRKLSIVLFESNPRIVEDDPAQHSQHIVIGTSIINRFINSTDEIFNEDNMGSFPGQSADGHGE
ncbi:MAG: hypothetical protein M3R25_00300 [Bacteroidota bacterium]|nr:hypothetical protein [Bacteroidota bacterium]